MIALRLVLAFLRDRPLTVLLQAALMAIGVAAATALLLFSIQSERRLARDAHGIDLVIGAKGSPLQLVMSAVFQADMPTGNIPFETVDALRRDPRVTEAVPIGLGDAAAGYRIVGADGGFVTLHDARLAEGRMYADPMEAVLGADTARALGLGVGDTFHGGHGLTAGGETHKEDYRVVGVLARTGNVIDRTILTSMESVWAVHGIADGAPREATAVLIRTRTPFLAMALKREINNGTALVAARPADEMARLFTLVGAGAEVLRGFALLMIAAAALSVFVALVSALRERRDDIALLRAMGASRATVFSVLIGQGVLSALAGTILGMAFGHLLIEALARASLQAEGFGLSGARIDPAEVWVAATGIGAGFLAALAPAIGAYRTDVAKALAEAA